MAFDVVVFGSFLVPAQHREDWLASPIDRSAAPVLDALGGDDVWLDTPEALLTDLSLTEGAPHEFLSVELHGERLAVRGFLGDDLFRQTVQRVALLVASTAPFGGVGELCFVGYRGLRFGDVLTVRDGRVRLHQHVDEAVAALEQRAGFQSVDRQIHARFDALVGRPEGHQRSDGGLHPFTGRRAPAAHVAG